MSPTEPLTIRTTCPYCGVGCGVLAEVNPKTRKISVSGDPDHPSNFGKLCSKGNALADTLDLGRRIAHPTIDGQRVTWDQATAHIAERFAEIIREHGPDSIMLYLSGQLLTEDYYVANKFAKGFLGTNNVDSNSRLCMSSAVAGYKRAFGSDTVPCNYRDIEDSELFVIVGANMAWCYPILFARLKAAKQANPAKQIVVIDPRATDSTLIADLHLPIRAGTDTHLFNGLLHYLHENGHADHNHLAHCDGIEEALETSFACSVENVARHCGVDEELVHAFYQRFAATKKTVSFFSMGVNQSSNGTDKVNAIINCHLYSGKIGFPGAGPFSMTGQPNAMGGREVGALANLLASHLELKSPEHRQLVQDFWQAPARISAYDGIKATQAADAILEGKIKAIWIIATNPVVSLPEADRFAMALKTCDLVVVSDCSKDSDTLDFANVVLPAQGWSEKSGTVTNAERRISRQRRLFPGFAEARPDWWIVAQVAQKMGFHGFAYADEHAVFLEHATLSGWHNDENTPRSFDLSHLQTLSREAYDALRPQQWGKAHYFGRDALPTDARYTDSGKLHLLPITPDLPKSLPEPAWPLSLNTGRLRDQWHTMTRSGLAAQLNQHLPEPFVSIHPDDASTYAIAARDFVHLSSTHGHVLVRAQLDVRQRPGDVFVPMHWNNHFTGNARVGTLINNHIDPYSQQPELKHTPVTLARQSMIGFARLLIRKDRDDALLAWLNDPAMDYWVRNRQQNSSEYRLAIGEQSPLQNRWFTPDFWHSILDNFLESPTGSPLHYHDPSAGDLRLAIVEDARLQAVIFVNAQEDKLPNHAWLDSLFTQPLDALTRKWLLAGRPASGFIDVGKIICSCMGVGENTIMDTIKTHHCTTPAEVGKHCQAGTNCGSCVSEINRLLSEAAS